MNAEETSTGKYWMMTLVSLIACLAFLFIKPEWFWVTLPFLFTALTKAMGKM